MNEVLNRELIRANFQFKEPNQQPLNAREESQNEEFGIQADQPEDDIERNSISSESVEEESQFEQSIFFNKGHKKAGADDIKLLERIHEYGAEEEDKEMIMGRVD